ncbi:MAG TPA: molybdopterin-dependent oxidoreductase [Gemmatimonadales bacterium]|nr:molybdopterin-dependent oxidoreductase [Gemmatimonadales bacterium]
MAELTRRDFLRLGAVAGAAIGAQACGWDGGPTLRPLLLGVSRLNDGVGQLLHTNGRLAPVYLPAMRSGHMPSYFISRRMPTLVRPADWSLDVAGLVRKPMRLALAELEALPRTSYTVKHHCVEGWTAIASWAGVPMRAVVELAEPTPDARYVRFDSFDDGYFNGWDLESAVHPQTILAYAFNDRPLTPEHGAPLRLYAPVKLGYKMTKYLTRITFTRERPGGYWEDRGYPWLGGL